LRSGGRKINWNEFLSARGGNLEAAAVCDFGDPRAELLAARDAAALTPLAHFGAIGVNGPDAGSFLQNQLTSDLRLVSPERAQLSAYCTPKGRVIASFLVAAWEGGYLLVVPAPVVVSLLARLQKYLLRSKAKLTDVSQSLFLLGLSGPLASQALGTFEVGAVGGLWSMAGGSHGSAIRLAGDNCLLITTQSNLPGLWAGLTRAARPAGAAAWDWSQIRAGIPWVLPETQELFLPQALGLEHLGGISFEKGCYPGQEIVARTHYRGELKRHLARGHAGHPLAAGQMLAAEDGETAATVVNAAPAPEGGWDCLAVAHKGAMERPLASGDGHSVELKGWVASQAVARAS
jgi:folate-binding protein YgfZ